METKKVFVKGIHPSTFRTGEVSEVIGLVSYGDNDVGYKVRFMDGVEDVFNVQGLNHQFEFTAEPITDIFNKFRFIVKYFGYDIEIEGTVKGNFLGQEVIGLISKRFKESIEKS